MIQFDLDAEIDARWRWAVSFVAGARKLPVVCRWEESRLFEASRR